MLENIFQFLGGIGLFLLGMSFLSEGLVAFGSGVLKTALIRFTGTPLKAFFSGVIGTVALQSSTATTVTLIGFVSAGLITFSQAIGVVIGASLGNTATGWIIATVGLKVNLGLYTLPLIGIGAFMRLIGRKRKIAYLGLAMAGFGMMFLGINTLQHGMSGITTFLKLGNLPVGGFWPSMATVLVGLVMTVMMQSSTAAVATVLTALHTQAVSFDQAAVLVVGAAIGTTLTGSISAIGGSIYAKRTAVAYILFNTISGLMAVLCLPLLFKVIQWIEDLGYIADGTTSLAAFHTLFISLGVLVAIPFIDKFSKFVEKILPEPKDNASFMLDKSLISIAPVALEASQNALKNLFMQLLEHADKLSQGQGLLIQDGNIEFEKSTREIYSFLSKVEIDAQDLSLVSRRIAQLHMLDHIQLLRQAILDASKTSINMSSDLSKDLFQFIKTNVVNADLVLKDQVNDGDTVLKSIADDVAKLTRRMRHALVSTTALLGATESQALGATDTLRGYEKVSHHIWKCSHYFSEASADLSKKPKTSESIRDLNPRVEPIIVMEN